MEEQNKLFTRPIGSRFECEGKTYEVVAANDMKFPDICFACALAHSPCGMLIQITGGCLERTRTDGVAVYFARI